MVILVEGYNYKNASFWGGPIIMQFIDFLGIHPSTKMAITPSKLLRETLKKTATKERFWGTPRPSPLLTLTLFTHFLVSQGSDSRERAQNYHFIYI